MKKINTYLWQITAKTNLHVGNEDISSCGIIDKAVQRDALTKLPCINASSLKGALNEFCCGLEDLDDKVRIQLFGSDKKNNNGVSAKGQAIFYDAQLLYLPVQTDNLFDYATCQGVIDIMNSRRKMFELNETPVFELNGREVQTMDSKEFSELCNNDNLPIIARNALGVNTNLWYEQVVPSETIFYAIIQEPNSALKDCMNGKIIQIGANATIGYGYCEFRCIAESTKSSSDGN